MVEDLSQFKNSPDAQVEQSIFDPKALPTLWKFSDSEEAEPYGYSFGFPCGKHLCFMPLLEELVEEPRLVLWSVPVCTTEEDAKRMFFLIDQLLGTITENS